MASTPSASALSAVLRCRGNIWARNPPTKRPSSAVYSLGLAGAALRDSSAERTGSNQASAWTLFPHRERVACIKRLAVACRWDRVGDDVSREEDYRKNNKLRHLKLSQSLWNPTPHPAPPIQNTLARGLKSALLGRDKCSKIIHMIEYKSQAAHICGIISALALEKLPLGVLKLSVTSPRLTVNSGQNPTGWSKLKNSCLASTYLGSKVLFLKLCRPSSSTDDAQHLPHQQENISVFFQTNGQIHMSSQDSPGCAQEVRQERPD